MQDTINIEEVIEGIRPWIELNGFFYVPDAVEDTGFTWQDSNGNRVDLSGYSLKSRISKYPEIGKELTGEAKRGAKKELERILKNERRKGLNIPYKPSYPGYTFKNNKYYSRDGIEIFKKPFMMHKIKLASTTEDFEFIFQREIAAANYKDSKSFREYLVAKISEMKTLEQSLPANDRKRSLDLQDLADRFLEWLSLRTEGILQSDAEETEIEKDALVLEIQKHLMPFEELMNETDYTILIGALKEYFNTGEFPVLKKVIRVKKTNKKRLGWALRELYKSQNSGDFFKYLSFAKDNISLFNSVPFNKNNFTKSTLYTYFTQKT